MECELDGITVHYEVFGQGRPILMLHGMPLDRTQMVYEMERHFTSRSGWRRIYLDMPGHGKTLGARWVTCTDQMLDVVEGFVDKVIQGERFAIAATSYGAYIAQGLVYRRGEAIDGVLLNVPVTIADRTKRLLPPRVVLEKDKVISDRAKAENNDWLELAAVVQNQETLDYARALQGCRADEKFLDTVRYGFSFDVNRLPQPFPAPALLILGREDHIVGYRDAWNILENYPRASFAILDRAGHMVLREQSAVCATLFQEWLDRVEQWISQTYLRPD